MFIGPSLLQPRSYRGSLTALLVGATLRLVFACHQLATQELAHRRFRDCLDEDIAPRPLVIGQPGGAAELIELVGRDRRAPLDEGADDLAPTLVGKPDHRNLRDRRIERQAALDLDRRDVLAAGD